MLPRATERAWRRIATVVPEGAYLVGGTALAIHLGHRRSRDLDFFTVAPFDPDALQAILARTGAFEALRITPGSLTGMFENAKVQFLDAHRQVVLDPPTVVAGIRVAGMRDLLAMKLKVIGDRGELRDYFDIMSIEERTEFRVEQGIGYYVARYDPQPLQAAVSHITSALGSFGDVADDPGLPVARARVERYWRRRQPQVIVALDTLRDESPC